MPKAASDEPQRPGGPDQDIALSCADSSELIRLTTAAISRFAAESNESGFIYTTVRTPSIIPFPRAVPVRRISSLSGRSSTSSEINCLRSMIGRICNQYKCPRYAALRALGRYIAGKLDFHRASHGCLPLRKHKMNSIGKRKRPVAQYVGKGHPRRPRPSS